MCLILEISVIFPVLYSGRQSSCRLNLGSSKRTSCLHSDDAAQQETNIEVYEFCVGSIRNSIFHILSTPLIPLKLQDAVLQIQYKLAYWCADKWPHSRIDYLFDTLYRSKLMDSKSFTSTQPLLFPKWCSSISLVRVLKAQRLDVDALIDRLEREENPTGELMGKSNVNLSKDIDYELKQRESTNEKSTADDEDERINAKYPKYAMKGEYQSDIIHHYGTLSKFETNYQCDEMYLVLSTRYAIQPSLLSKLLFLPHWTTVLLLSKMTHQSILSDLGKNLEFVAQKHSESQDEDNTSKWHKLAAEKRKKTLE